MKAFLMVLLGVLIFVVIFQIAKASEYVSVLKGEEKTRRQNNRINAFLLMGLLIFGLIGVWYCNELYYGKTLFPQGSASVEGEKIDTMLYITIAITGVVFVITQILLFWFSYKYQESDNRKAFYYPHNNKLELLWTTVPAIFLTVLVVFGLKYWFKITADAPSNALVVEVTGHQFAWEFRYPGADGVLGKKNFKLTTSKNNLGVDFSDPASKDDIHLSNTMHIPVGVPIKMVIHSQDVIHDVGLPHFRLKMDAVPGIPTTQWFTPKYTTAEMKQRTGNPDFTYEIACDQLCGANHFAMRGVIIVETMEEYKKWLAEQKSEYATLFEKKEEAKPAADSVAPKQTAQVLPAQK
ncbi:MAG TPA: cytochrome c oxidase subunit II [Ferruginibacter sp.]|nr:cytochrome c oxidase subunit II [Ferruginibacter sp.]HNF42064.1 cytochrome c oxidase subunit II [Ferruginibacter sp.]HNJ93134.1 cytochrome c oxidase subunit II [Ferruginibacter sp.]